MSQDMIVALRTSKSSTSKSGKSGTSKSKTGTSKGKSTTGTTSTTVHKTGTNNKHHNGSGGNAVWFAIMAVVAVLVIFFGIKFFRGRSSH